MQIDIEQLAKLAYETRLTENNNVSWEDAISESKDFYRKIAIAQQQYIEALINKQSNKVIHSLRNWVIFQLIPIIQPSLTHREKNELLAKLMEDLTKIKLVASEEPDPDDIPFDSGAVSPENF